MHNINFTLRHLTTYGIPLLEIRSVTLSQTLDVENFHGRNLLSSNIFTVDFVIRKNRTNRRNKFAKSMIRKRVRAKEIRSGWAVSDTARIFQH